MAQRTFSFVLWFLWARWSTIVLHYVNTAVILVLAGLVMSYAGVSSALLRAQVPYALLLSSTVLGAFLVVDYIRTSPFNRQLHHLLQGKPTLEALANLPPGATSEQKTYREFLERFHETAVADLMAVKEMHQRQLAFIHMWVHQMKTPVSTINLITQERDAYTEDVAALLDSIDEETAELNSGLEMILNMARLQDFHVDYIIRPVDLLESVRSVINARKKQLIKNRIFPLLEAAEGDWHVLTDEKWNKFVLDQIVANAIKYAAQTGKAGQKLRFQLTRDVKTIKLTIADEGPGIPSADVPRIFEPFYTGENGRRFGGATGIGLYLVKQVVERLGHEIAVDSHLGEGTKVTLTYTITPTE